MSIMKYALIAIFNVFIVTPSHAWFFQPPEDDPEFSQVQEASGALLQALSDILNRFSIAELKHENLNLSEIDDVLKNISIQFEDLSNQAVEENIQVPDNIHKFVESNLSRFGVDMPQDMRDVYSIIAKHIEDLRDILVSLDSKGWGPDSSKDLSSRELAGSLFDNASKTLSVVNLLGLLIQARG